MAELTEKQQIFVQEYLMDLNATQAVIRAGYSQRAAKQMGFNLLNKPHIRKAVDDAMSERVEKAKIDAEGVLERLMHIYEVCAQTVPMGETGKEKLIDPHAANRAMELYGKHLAMFTDKQQITTVNELEGKDEDELQLEADRLYNEIAKHQEGTGTQEGRGKVAVLRPPQKTGEVS